MKKRLTDEWERERENQGKQADVFCWGRLALAGCILPQCWTPHGSLYCQLLVRLFFLLFLINYKSILRASLWAPQSWNKNKNKHTEQWFTSFQSLSCVWGVNTSFICLSLWLYLVFVFLTPGGKLFLVSRVAGCLSPHGTDLLISAEKRHPDCVSFEVNTNYALFPGQ